MLKQNFSKYCASIYKNSGINCDWSINSSSQFLDSIKQLDVYNMQVYDFTTLYTNLDLGVGENLLFEMIDLLFSVQLINTSVFLNIIISVSSLKRNTMGINASLPRA